MSTEEQTEILRNIWTQMVAMERNLSARIDGLSARLDSVESKLSARIDRLEVRFEQLEVRMRRNFERIDLGLLLIQRRLDDLDARVTRIEEHLGLPVLPPLQS